MSKKARDFPGQAFLELLRPPKLSTTRLALFATYSADPIVLGGALLNLHARGRDTGGGNKADFANAVEALRDKVRFIVQRGRIHRGQKLPKIAAVFDQFVVEVPFQERSHSWHPKLALLCYELDGRRYWRLWIGSRNLTMSRDLDLGLMLDGEPRRRQGSQVIGGIDAVGAELARQAALPEIAPEAIAEELRSVRWIAPSGITVSRVELWLPEIRPEPPFGEGEKRKIVVLSPFLTDNFVASFASATALSADRTLVTTLPALRGLTAKGKASLAGLRLLSLTAPMPNGDDSTTRTTIVPAEQDDLESEAGKGADHSGLHAKLYAAMRGDKVDIVAGSANGTSRAWSGGNAEAVARFSGGRSEMDGIAAIVGSAYPVAEEVLQSLLETEADKAEKRLEQARWVLADLPFTLRRTGKRFSIECASPPSIPAEARLEAGLATMPILTWPKGTKTLKLGEIPLALQTDLIQFRLSLGALTPACWLQRAVVTPLIDSDRDSAAISRFLSVAGLQTWLREMLEPESTAGSEDDWDADEGSEGAESRQSWKHDGFALEDMLAAWARNDLDKLRRVDRMLDRYVAAVLAHSEHISEKDRLDLTALQETWKVARDVLLSKP